MANAKVRIFNSEGLKMKKINFLSLGAVLTKDLPAKEVWVGPFLR